jgi:hypothetical protein
MTIAEQVVFDIPSTTKFMHTLGFSGITDRSVYGLITRGTLKSVRCGKKLYVTREAVLDLIGKLERRQK